MSGERYASDRRNCNLNLDASPPSRPGLPCEPQLRGRRPRSSLHVDRTAKGERNEHDAARHMPTKANLAVTTWDVGWLSFPAHIGRLEDRAASHCGIDRIYYRRTIGEPPTDGLAGEFPRNSC
jgi:hypothetical protein